MISQECIDCYYWDGLYELVPHPHQNLVILISWSFHRKALVVRPIVIIVH